MSLVVHPASPEDWPAIAELNVAAYGEFAPHLAPDAWEKMRTNVSSVESVAQRAEFLVIRDSRGLAGSVGYCPAGKSDPRIFPADWPSILLLAVSPNHRGGGIARTLVNACVDRARKDAAPAIGLFTSELMIPAQRLYDSMGFVRDLELPVRLGLQYWRYRLDLECDAAENPILSRP